MTNTTNLRTPLAASLLEKAIPFIHNQEAHLALAEVASPEDHLLATISAEEAAKNENSVHHVSFAIMGIAEYARIKKGTEPIGPVVRTGDLVRDLREHNPVVRVVSRVFEDGSVVTTREDPKGEPDFVILQRWLVILEQN
jgi:hypothetical protein